MAKKQTDSVTDLLEMASGDVQSLLEEMEEWQGNMEGANMDHLPKFEQVTECVDALQNADLATYVEHLVEAIGKADQLELSFDDQIEHTVSTAKRQSRADRLGQACGYLESALDAIASRVEEHRAALKDQAAASESEDAQAEGVEEPSNERSDALDDVESAAEDVRNAWDELLGVDFPGAFGG